MGSSSGINNVCVVVILMCMVTSAPYIAESAISNCGSVAGYISPCILYALKKGLLTKNCCNGVKGLYNAAQTTSDRRTVCTCLKKLAGSSAYPNAAGIPGKCGVSTPYKISPSTDCTRIN